jgi:hypothetical protein
MQFLTMSFCFRGTVAGIVITTVSAFSYGAEKVLTLLSVPRAPIVDGVIDDIWSLADSTNGFFQMQPYFGKDPSETTVAKVIATNEAMYCLIVSRQESADIQDISSVHDQTNGDVVSLMLDTFGDKQTAYKFAVSAAGVQGDARMLDDARNRDYSWDGVWFARSRVYSWGFVVEMEIPFKSLRYNGELAEWGLDFDRWIASKSEDLYWCSYEQNEGQRISRFGTLRLNGSHPTLKGLNLEVYPVALARATYTENGKYKVEPDAGIDIFYNPSEQLTLQLTGNPDFAQIEADPFQFNISRYESYFDERRPFFTAGKEVFMAAGRDNNSGFYRPLELFYSRRIGKVLDDGTRVPLEVGAKTHGRLGSWEYGAFFARTGGADYTDDDDIRQTEPAANFSSVRLKKRILENSDVGLLFVGKQTPGHMNGVIDIDGAFRGSDWQLAYQCARSINDGKGDFGGSFGFTRFGKSWAVLTRARAIGNGFDVDEVGFVPWQGTAQFTTITGPIWYFDTGALSQIFLYGGFEVAYEEADLFTDWIQALGWNMQFRSNWGYEVTLIRGSAKDEGEEYTSSEIDVSTWFHTSPRWEANVYGGYSHSYNFDREYVAFYSWLGSRVEWKASSALELGTSFNMYVEGNPAGNIEDITYNARPYVSVTPINNLNLRLYADNVFVKSSDRLERVILGFLFSYNFLPKSWIYLALNEVQERKEEYTPTGDLLPMRMHTTERAGVFKVKYLYYF